jgi:hypothetical protein
VFTGVYRTSPELTGVHRSLSGTRSAEGKGAYGGLGELRAAVNPAELRLNREELRLIPVELRLISIELKRIRVELRLRRTELSLISRRLRLKREALRLISLLSPLANLRESLYPFP